MTKQHPVSVANPRGVRTYSFVSSRLFTSLLVGMVLTLLLTCIELAIIWFFNPENILGSDSSRRLSALAALPLQQGASQENGLRDGEDYELLFALPAAAKNRLEREWRRKFSNLRLTAIGRLVENGRTHLSGKGYDHFV